MSTISTTDRIESGAAGADPSAALATRYLTVTLNGEGYALNIFNVTEILEYRPLTSVPMMPQFIRGVINLRGRAVPVIDLATRFGTGTTTIARRTSIVIVHIGGYAGPGDGSTEPGSGPADRAPDGQDIGILVDAVNKVVDFSAEDIEPPPTFGAGIHAKYLSGMAKRDNDFIIVLDVDHVLSLDDLIDLGNATAGTGPA